MSEPLQEPTQKAPAKHRKKAAPKGLSSDWLSELPASRSNELRRELRASNFIPRTHQLPKQVLPDPELVHIIDQGDMALSVGSSIAAALNYLRMQQGITQPVSPGMIENIAKRYDEYEGTSYSGSSLAGGLAAVMELGVCLEHEWPLSSNFEQGPPSTTVLESAKANRPAAVQMVEVDEHRLKAAIFERQVVIVHVTLHENDGWYNPDPQTGYLNPTTGNDTVTGGHAVALMGYTEEGFLVQNSWGASWSTAVIQAPEERRYPGMAIWRFEDALRRILEAWALSLVKLADKATLIHYDADNLSGPDLLEIKADVDSFSHVLASQEIQPPLALGLFGHWGSGKSFFMQAMQRRISVLVDRKQPPFCQSVVQIPFNAWHYLDSNLWASLVTEIFDQLFQYIDRSALSKREEQTRLTQQLQQANGVYQHAKQQLELAQNELKAATDKFNTASEQRQIKEASLGTALEDLGQLIGQSSDLQKSLNHVATQLGINEITTSYRAFQEHAGELVKTGQRASALLKTMLLTSGSWKRILVLAGVILVPVPLSMLIMMALQTITEQPEFKTLYGTAMQVSTGLASVAAWLALQVKRAAGFLTEIENTRTRIDSLRENRKAQWETQSANDLQILKTAEAAAQENLHQAESRVQALQREIEDQKPAQLIKRFIKERAQSTDYRSQLSLVSLIRKDFETLSRLANPKSKDHGLMPVERIILYIDDLDRCKPERVIEVLEAVHLLLAFPLFMVVVAVDPRWLQHCLEKQYPDLLTTHAQADGELSHLTVRIASTQDYLEKIFQIPFLLKPLRTEGFKRMVQGLTRNSIAVEAPTDSEHLLPPNEDLEDMDSETDDTQITATKTDSGKATQLQAEDSTGIHSDQNDTADISEEPDELRIAQLQLRAWEVEDMQRLAPLFNTPRAVKRFVNSYRFIRAGVFEHELTSFEGSREQPGNYRAAMLLLAVVVNHGVWAPTFLRMINSIDNNTTLPWRTFVDSLTQTPKPKSTKQTSKSHGIEDVTDQEQPHQYSYINTIGWRQMCTGLSTLTQERFGELDVRSLKPWVETVARYTFTLAGPELNHGM